MFLDNRSSIQWMIRMGFHERRPNIWSWPKRIFFLNIIYSQKHLHIYIYIYLYLIRNIGKGHVG